MPINMSAPNAHLPACANDGFAHAAALLSPARGTAPLQPLPALPPLAPGSLLGHDVRARRFGAWLQFQELRAAGRSVASTDWVLIYDPIDRIERLPEVSSCILTPIKASLTCIHRAPSAPPPSLWRQSAPRRALALECLRWGWAPVPAPLSLLSLWAEGHRRVGPRKGPLVGPHGHELGFLGWRLWAVAYKTRIQVLAPANVMCPVIYL